MRTSRAVALLSCLAGLCAGLLVQPSSGGLRREVETPVPRVGKVELQPLAAQAVRVADALDRLGEPLTPADRKAIMAAKGEKDHAKGCMARSLTVAR